MQGWPRSSRRVRQAHRAAPTAALHREGARAALLCHGAHLQARPRVRGHHGGRIRGSRGHAGASAGTAPVAAVAAAGQGIFQNTVAALVTMGTGSAAVAPRTATSRFHRWSRRSPTSCGACASSSPPVQCPSDYLRDFLMYSPTDSYWC